MPSERLCRLGALGASCAARAAMALVMVSAAWGAPVEYRLPLAADTTIYAAQGGGTEYDAVSDGAGANLWTAVTAGGVIRRALLRFDLAAIPAGSQVLSVTLTLHEIRSRETHATSLHRVLAPWGEAGSDGGDAGIGAQAQSGDATWSHRLYPTVVWAQRGGDFVPGASSSLVVGGAPAFYTWPSTAQLVADVQGWVDQPAAHHGWIVIGTETGQQNAKRWASRQQASPTVRPLLIVRAEPPADNGEIPVPAWALLLLGAGLATGLARTARRR